MGFTNRFWINPEIRNQTALKKEQIRSVWLLRLPFRIRLGEMRRINCGNNIEIVIHNPVLIPQGTNHDTILKAYLATKDDKSEIFCTEAAIIDYKPKVDNKDAKRIIDFIGDASGKDFPGYEHREYAAFSALNDFIIGYHSITQDLFPFRPLHTLSYYEFANQKTVVGIFVCGDDGKLSDDECLEFFRKGEGVGRVMVGTSLHLTLDDFPEEIFPKIEGYIEKHKTYIFYQFALTSKVKMISFAYHEAILFIVIAMEAALGVLLTLLLRRRLSPETPSPDKKADDKAQNMIKEIGVTETLTIVNDFLLDRQDRLPENIIEKCKEGITIRNEIMHAARKKGQYKIRNKTNSQMQDGYSDVFKVYNHFVNLIEKLEDTSSSPPDSNFS